MEPVVAPTAYLPSIAYMTQVIRSDRVIIDIHEHYVKQTCRNRATIGSANGELSLIIPVKKVLGNHTPVTAIETDNAQRWQIHHWRAIESAYRSSPYFLFYKDDFHYLYNKSSTFLVNFNTDLFRLICKLAGIDIRFSLSERYMTPGSSGRDLRCGLSTDLADGRPAEPYSQVFQHKFGFIANLSVIDLLFNIGPETRAYLERQSLSKKL